MHFTGRGCGAVGKAVASDTRDPQIEFRHRQNFLNLICVSTVSRKDENKQKRARNGPLKKVFTPYEIESTLKNK